MASLFCTPDRYDKTNVLLLDEGETYFPVKIIPIAGGDPLTNNKLHENSINAIVSNLNIECSTRTQFVSTLGIDIYAYTFGETLDTLTISGFGFMPCGTGDSGKSDNGFNDILNFWDVNNIGKHGKACTVYINDIMFKAYLVNAEIGSTEKLLGLFPFKFTFQALRK